MDHFAAAFGHLCLFFSVHAISIEDLSPLSIASFAGLHSEMGSIEFSLTSLTHSYTVKRLPQAADSDRPLVGGPFYFSPSRKRPSL